MSSLSRPLNVLIFGSTGMVGQGVLRECLTHRSIGRIQTIGRSLTGIQHAKLTEIQHTNMFDYSNIESSIRDLKPDACFFCLGTTSAGMNENDYTHLTYDLTLSVIQLLSRINSSLTFIYVSGQSTDPQSSTMWKKVKGKTENAAIQHSWTETETGHGGFAFRPGAILAGTGIKSKTKLYRYLYPVFYPLIYLVRAISPNTVLTTEEIGRAMIYIACHGYEKRVLESADIHQVAVKAISENE